MKQIDIRRLAAADIPIIAAAFAEIGWHKPASQYKRYLAEQQAGERIVWLVHVNQAFAGYVTLVWKSGYQPFREAGIPEIVDLNVLPRFQRNGLASRLLDAAEAEIATRAKIAGIGVGLTADYGPAQILYIQRGYLPDGRGISWNGKTCQYNDRVLVDDGLTLYFTKAV